MKKKIILGSIAGVVVIVVAAVLIVVARLDGIVKSTVEREGTAQLKLATTLDNANVSILAGSLTLDELTIANPEGYSAPHIFELGQVNVDVSYGELMDDPVRVQSININSPRLVIERGGAGLSELGKINLRELLAGLETGGDSQTRLLIGQINVTGTQVVIRPNLQGLDEEYVVTIPDVTLTEVGTAQEAKNGTEIGRVTAEVAMALARRAAESSELPPELRGLLAGDLQSILEQYKGKLNEAVRQRLEAELGDLREELGPEVAGAADRLLRGDGGGAVEETRQKVEEKVQGEVQRGLNDLLGGRRRTGDPATKPSTRPSGT